MNYKHNTKMGFCAKKNDSGITLITLVITIIVLLILASVATLSGIDSINSSKFTKFKAELKIMQTHINQWYEELKSSDNTEFTNNIRSKFEGAGATNNDAQAKTTLTTIGITNEQEQAKYYLLKKEQKDRLKIDGVEQDILVNVKDRKVVSYKGIKYKDNMYYTLNDTEFYNVGYIAQTGKPEHFNIKYENLKQGLTKVTIYDVDYDGYNAKWRVNYKKTGSSNYSRSEDLTFNVTEDGNYTIQLISQNGEIVGDEETFFVSTIKNINSTLAGETDKTKMNSKNPVIPKGFKAVNIDSTATNFEGDSTALWQYTDNTNTEIAGWNNGLVIEDEEGNQFVWVPCTMGTSQDVVTYSKNFSYPSNYSASELNTANALDTTTVDGVKYSAIPVRENEQIFDYGGFYVARYEAGLPTETLDQSAALNNVYTSIPISKYGSKVWNYIDYTHSYVAAEKMINNTGKYGSNKSGLITGTQWDTIMKWYEKNNIPVLSNNQNWGTYKNRGYSFNGLFFINNATNIWNDNTTNHVADSSSYLYHGTGLNASGYEKNIADLGGNFWEWQNEQMNSETERIYRGGDAGNSSLTYSSSYRCKNINNRSIYQIGFRPVLYIQDEIQKDYVTDGLLAYYDAENNTGMGHSFTTTTWNDLSGNNNNATIETTGNSLNWHSNCLETNKVESIITPWTFSTSHTISVVFEPLEFYNYNTIWENSLSTDDNEGWIYNNGTFAARSQSGQSSLNSVLSLDKKITIDVTIDSGNQKCELYINGEKLKTDSSINLNGGALIFNGGVKNTFGKNKYYLMKVYNRALTEEEILQNYEIDKVRFNIQE